MINESWERIAHLQRYIMNCNTILFWLYTASWMASPEAQRERIIGHVNM